jgi:pimeloyl-ACP methyl ester carboxylesterase
MERLGRFALNRRGLTSRWIHTELAPLHVYDAVGKGTLPTIVLLHGIGSAATPFGPVLARLLPHVERVIAPDYPGHGFSGAPKLKLTPKALFETMESVLDEMTTRPAIVVGNSLGGALALRFAIDRPDKVKALVLASPAGARMSEDEWRGLRESFDLQTVADANDFMHRVYHRPPWFAPLVARELPSVLKRAVVRDILESATPHHSPEPDELRSLSLPILFLWGRSERLLPASNLAYFREHLPAQTIFEEPHDIGHCPHLDDPGWLARRIVSFVRDVAGERA